MLFRSIARGVCRRSPLPSRSFCSRTKAPYLAQLLRWLEDHGGYGQFCVVSSDLSYEKGRGMFAVEPLKPEGPVIIITYFLLLFFSFYFPSFLPLFSLLPSASLATFVS